MNDGDHIPACSPRPISEKVSHCLLCLQAVHCDLNVTEVSEILSDLFEVLCKYMEWSPPLKYHFNFKEDTFPFCKECKSRLVTLYKSHQVLDEVQKQIKSIISALCGKILLSQRDKKALKRSKSTGCSQNGNKSEEIHPQNDIKINYYRDLIVRRYSTSVRVTVYTPQPLDPLSTVANVPERFVVGATEERNEGINEVNDFDLEDVEFIDTETVEGNLESHITTEGEIIEKVTKNGTGNFEGPEQVVLNPPKLPKTRNQHKEKRDQESTRPQSVNKNICHRSGQTENSDYVPTPASRKSGPSDDLDGSFKGIVEPHTNEGIKVPSKFSTYWGKLSDRVRTVSTGKYLFDGKYAFEYSEKKWVCCSCNHKFQKKIPLMNHLAETCKGGVFKAITTHKFAWINAFNQAYSFERVRDTYECNQCSFSTSTSLLDFNIMKSHVLSLHFDKQKQSWSCNMCGRKCCSSSMLKKHLERHTRDAGSHNQSEGWRGQFFDRVRIVANGKFLFDEKFAFEYNSEGKWVCCTCKYPFQRKIGIVKHLASSCNGYVRNTFKIITPNKFAWTDPSNRTFSFEKVDRSYKCDQCSFSNSSLSYMKVHIRCTHIDPGSSTCSKCGKFCSTSTALKTHLLSHTDDRPVVCEFCGKSYKTLHALTFHKVRKHLEIFEKGNYKCEECERVFGHKKLLIVHSKTHQKFVCDVCGKNVRITNMNNHMLSHGEQNTCECKKCGKRFRQRNGLNAHLKSHDGAKPYECDICGMKFTQSYSVTRHKNVVHNSSKATKTYTKPPKRKRQDEEDSSIDEEEPEGSSSEEEQSDNETNSTRSSTSRADDT